LDGREGVRVIGGVPDVRPYLSNAQAIVAPLRLARGIQNKVLEALAMGRPVYASEAVCRTFGLPADGVRPCRSASNFVQALASACGQNPECNMATRAAALRRFSWDRNLQRLSSEVERLIGGDGETMAAAAAGARSVHRG
jgi:glycosyltransferase involved in cell wall biosynthesis